MSQETENKQIVIRWTVEVTKITPFIVEAFHGETIRLEPSFTRNGKPLSVEGGEVTLYWQPRGTSKNAFWPKPGEVVPGKPDTVRVDFTNEEDVGENAYTWYIGVKLSDEPQYRAYGTLSMKDSPGFMPNKLPWPPPETIDLSEYIFLNAPWQDKKKGYGLSKNDFSNSYKKKLDEWIDFAEFSDLIEEGRRTMGVTATLGTTELLSQTGEMIGEAI